MRFLLPYFKIFHGSFNILVILLLIYQGWLGINIMKNRTFYNLQIYKIIIRHRKFCPFLVCLGLLGFFAGIILIYIDKDHLFEYPLHFIVGLLISLSLIETFLSSKKISSGKKDSRKIHSRFGFFTILLYIIQIILGIKILF